MGLGETQGWSKRLRKILSSSGFDPRTVQPVAIRCTAWAVPSHAASLLYTPTIIGKGLSLHEAMNPDLVEVHYLIHKCPPPVPLLSQLDPVHSPKTHFLKIHLNIILPPTPVPPKWSLFLRFRHQNPVHASPLPHTCHMTCTSHSSWF